MALFDWASPSRLQTDQAEFAELCKELQAEHARLAINLRTGYDQLMEIKRVKTDANLESLLVGYKALMAIVDREDFTRMAPERMPVVISQVVSRLERLGRLLRQTDDAGPALATLPH